MTLVKWDPFRDLFNVNTLPWRFADTEDSWGSWTPPVDVFERGDDLVIHAEIPGVGKEDIDVRVEDNTLVLRGERKRDSEVADDKTFRRERSYGNFVRSFRLPKTVDARGIAASYRAGVLEITLPKAEEAKPKKVEIKVA